MWILKTLALSGVLALPMTVAALADTGPAQITVTGEASVNAVPDMALISLGVTTQGKTASAAMSANSQALAAVLQRLKAAGIDDRDIQTSNLSLNPNWVGYDNGQSPTISGYTASNQLGVRVRVLDGLGTVLDAAIADGANTLNGITFELSQPRPAQDQARKAATEDARARAELLAQAAAVKLGRVLSITEDTGGNMPMPMYKADAISAPVPVQAGEIATIATVTITFEILQ